MITTCIRVLGSLPVSIQPERNIDIMVTSHSDAKNLSTSDGIPSLLKSFLFFSTLTIFRSSYLLGYFDTWSDFEAVKTAPWLSLELHHFGKFLESSDEWAGRGSCCFRIWWHSWAFLAHQEWAPEICRAQIWIFQFTCTGHCQLPANEIVKLYYSLVYSHLTYALLAWGRSESTNAAKIECAHRRTCKLLTDYNQKILTFHSIYDYFALLKAFNTNILNFH